MSTKYRADVIDDLMDRVRRHHEAWDAVEVPGAQDSVQIERGRRRPPIQPLHQPPTAEERAERAYDANMYAANWSPTHGGMFGRKAAQKYHVVESSESRRMQPRLPPETPFGQAALPPPTAGARHEQLPGWLRQQMALNEAYLAIDRALAAYKSPLTRGAVAAMGAAPVKPGHTPLEATPRGEDLFERPPQPLPAEATNPNFRYDTKQIFFWSLAPSDDSVVGGTGAEWKAGDREVTRTYFGRPPRRA